jgi:hypothetical protein
MLRDAAIGCPQIDQSGNPSLVRMADKHKGSRMIWMLKRTVDVPSSPSHASDCFDLETRVNGFPVIRSLYSLPNLRQRLRHLQRFREHPGLLQSG